MEEKTRDNPVKVQMDIGGQVGVEGTPTIVTDSDRLLPVDNPAAQLAQMLVAHKKNN